MDYHHAAESQEEHQWRRPPMIKAVLQGIFCVEFLFILVKWMWTLILELPMILYITQSFSVNLCLWILSLQFLIVYNIMLNTKTYYSKICNIPCLPHIPCTFCWIYRRDKSCSCLCYISGFGRKVHSRSVGKCYIERKKKDNQITSFITVMIVRS